MNPLRKRLDHLRILKRLVGARCERSLAVNSLKIRFGCQVDKRGISYIGIDPPWVFKQNDKLITTAWECPAYEEKEEDEYPRKFKKWSDHLNPLNSTVLKAFSYTREHELELIFTDGYTIFLPQEDFQSSDDTYIHWYAKTF